MLSKTAQLVMIAAVAAYFILLLVFLRKKQLNLRYTLLWIFSGILMLVLALFPRVLTAFAALVGIYSEVNALFALILFCGIVIVMSLTAIVSMLNDKLRRTAQTVALLEKRVRELEKTGEEKI